MDDAVLIWIIVAVVFAVIELATMAFVALYFALGAAAGGVAAAFGLGLGWQIAAFGITSIVLLSITRPVIKKRVESPDVATNVDRMTGRGGIVTIEIDNDASTGQIRVGTEYWTARRVESDAPQESIPVDARVRIVAVEGVTARVELSE
jgi:membrane protein implicated in regulation of membrane protease activity